MPPDRGMRGSPEPSHPPSIELHSPFSACLGAARDGKAWALAALYRGLHAKLLRYLVGRDPALAGPVAARVWEDVARGLPSFDGDEAEFTSWAFVLARRHLDHVRDEALDLAADGAEFVVDPATRAALDRVARLPDAEADVFLLRTVAGLSVDEVAWIIHKPRPVVRELQQRAIERLVHAPARTEELVA